jgi:thioredoxin 1
MPAGNAPVALNAQNFSQEVIRSEEPVLVLHWARWCSQSMELMDEVKKLGGERGRKLKVATLEYEESQALRERYGVARVPTIFIFERGVVKDRLYGRVSAETLAAAASQHLADLKDVSDSTFAAEVVQDERPVVVTFWDSWCAASLKVLSTIERASAGLRSQVKFVKVRFNDNPQTCARHDVTRIPVVMVFRDGVCLDFIGGPASEQSISQMVNRALRGSAAGQPVAMAAGGEPEPKA